MASDLDDLADPERRLCEALAAYFDAVKAGEAPEREAWLARYPESGRRTGRVPGAARPVAAGDRAVTRICAERRPPASCRPGTACPHPAI